MIRKITTLITLSALLVTGSALAADRTGEFALGFNNSDAPVGLRYFFSENVAADLGLGLESQDLGDESATSLWVEFGVPFVLYDYDSSFFFVRPALTFASLDDRIYGTGSIDDTWSVIALRLNLGAEVRLAERFGLTFQHGLGLTSTSPPGDGDNLTSFGTFGENATEAGVWFTF
ncbi:hypothetical protein KJ682_10920 [bacterium]|nr:hypothetical protein [bacterium]